MSQAVARHRTALQRRQLSRPIRLALEDKLITQSTSIFDYGCGRGYDSAALKELGFSCEGWDPTYFPEQPHEPADVVNLGYVVNVIEDVDERASALRTAWSLTHKLLIVSARLTVEANKTERIIPYGDGCLTCRDTFQKFYDQRELRDWINEVLAVSSTPAAPGVFYVFRDLSLQQSFAALHYRRASAIPAARRRDVLFEQHKEVFERLMEFIAMRGRLPSPDEFQLPDPIHRDIGSVNRAFTIIRQVTGPERWEQLRQERAQDLLIYIALSRFGRRPRFSDLPLDLQLDIRVFFGSYRKAFDMADDLLFSAGNSDKVDKACQASTVGKLMPAAFYVHVSALQELPQILRIYEGCARSYVGSVEGANVVKLYRREPRVSYLSYADFERDPHPALIASLTVPLQTFRIRFRDYRDSDNPFILHRKEELVSVNYRLREKFSRLTRQEERHGLYSDPELIGTRRSWRLALSSRALRLVGHRVVRASA